MSKLSHIGHVVADLRTSIRFYTGLLGFDIVQEAKFPSSRLDGFLKMKPPRAMHAIYLVLEDAMLELMQLDPAALPSAGDRQFGQTGLTHLSFIVDDPAGIAARAAEFGGESFGEIGTARMIRDPDGQFIELLDRSPLEARPGA